MKRLALGGPKDLRDSTLFHSVALVPVLAWVGMGADGLSSSAYGPEESFRALAGHVYLAPAVVLATVLTILIISVSYSRVIEHFPHGGGGYTVASHVLGPLPGLLSGCALTVDYMLTITVSVAAGGDALFSYLPLHWHHWKLAFEVSALCLLIVLNLRGVKESVLAVLPIFLAFVLTHLLLIGSALFLRWNGIPQLSGEIHQGWIGGLATQGGLALFLIFLHAYSMGAGTYTGIEAVSNGLAILRTPQVTHGKRTMLYMAVSLVLASGGLFLGYLLLGIHPVRGQTLNAVLASEVFTRLLPGEGLRRALRIVTLASEAGLLVIAAQTGFIDGPRVIANMAVDSWLPKRLSTLSERFTMQNGVLLFGGASLAALLHTRGNTSTLVLMYSINVFITFSLTQLSMTRLYLRPDGRSWRRFYHVASQGVGLLLCLAILVVMILEKFEAGGWLTLLATGILVCLCLLTRRHYNLVLRRVRGLDQQLENLLVRTEPIRQPTDPSKPTAILLVDGYGGVGIHSLFTIFQLYYPGYFKNAVFVSVGLVNSGNFKGAGDIANLRQKVETDLKSYADLARRMEIPAEYEMQIGTEVVQTATDLCIKLKEKYPLGVVFASKLVFEKERWYLRFLHNHSAYAVQRHLEWEGIPMTILPVRVVA